MKAIELTITVLPDGSIHVPPRPELAPGEHRAVLVVEEAPVQPSATRREPLNLPVIDAGPWPANLSLHREDLYDDWGR